MVKHPGGQDILLGVLGGDATVECFGQQGWLVLFGARSGPMFSVSLDIVCFVKLKLKKLKKCYLRSVSSHQSSSNHPPKRWFRFTSIARSRRWRRCFVTSEVRDDAALAAGAEAAGAALRGALRSARGAR